MKYPDHLLKMIASLKKLPGVGSKSAERFAFYLLNWSDKDLFEMAEVIKTLKENLKHCVDCGCLMDKNCCYFCNRSSRDSKQLCIIASAKDAYLIEETREYRGFYQVIGSIFSPIHGKTIDSLILEKIKKRIYELEIEEIIIALDATLEGDATASFIKKELDPLNIPTSRLALGIPMGSSLDFIDGGTLARALSGRRSY